MQFWGRKIFQTSDAGSLISYFTVNNIDTNPYTKPTDIYFWPKGEILVVHPEKWTFSVTWTPLFMSAEFKTWFTF